MIYKIIRLAFVIMLISGYFVKIFRYRMHCKNDKGEYIEQIKKQSIVEIVGNYNNLCVYLILLVYCLIIAFMVLSLISDLKIIDILGNVGLIIGVVCFGFCVIIANKSNPRF